MKYIGIVASIFILIAFSKTISSQPLNGTYTIGGDSPNYESFSNAVSALVDNGIDGSVIFSVRDHDYVEQISIPEIEGSSSINTVTFESESGNSNRAFIYFRENLSNPYTIKLDGADNFIFKNLGISAADSRTGQTILLENGASNNQFIGNKFVGASYYTPSNAIRLVNSIGENLNNSFIGNVFSGGEIGFLFSCSINEKVGVKLQENKFEDQKESVQFINLEAPEITKNKFKSTSSRSYIAVHLLNCRDTFKIVQNEIISESGIGIYIDSCNNTPNFRGQISNNLISISKKGAKHGVYFRESSNQNCYHNNVGVGTLLTDTTVCSALKIIDSKQLELINNIFSNEQRDGYAIHVDGYDMNSDYNDFYSTGEYLAYFNEKIKDLGEWREKTGKDFNSFSVNPNFLSKTDLHIQQFELYKKGSVLPGLKIDFDGDLRELDGPTVGADEYTLPSDVGITKILSPNFPFKEGLQPIAVTLKNFARDTLFEVKIQIRINQIDTILHQWNGYLLPSDSVEVYLGDYDFKPGLEYDIEVFTVEPNGQIDNNPLNDKARILDVYSSLGGTYTIGGDNPDFLTVLDATWALNRGGIISNVVFNIRPGIYEGRIYIGDFYGNSCDMSVVFQSENGDKRSVVITGVGKYIFQIYGANGITIKGLHLKTTYSNVLKIERYSSCLTIVGNILEANETGADDPKRAIIYSGEYSAESDNVFEDNELINGTYGLYFASEGPRISERNIIRNNRISSPNAGGIYMKGQIDPIVEGNHITSGSSSYSNFEGINLQRTTGEYRVISNKIIVKNGGAGIVLSTGGWFSDQMGLVVNNFVSVGGEYRSIGISAGGFGCKIINNNILITGTHYREGKAIHLRTIDMDSVLLFNNNIINLGAGYALYADGKNLISNNNNIYTKGDILAYFKDKGKITDLET